MIIYVLLMILLLFVVYNVRSRDSNENEPKENKDVKETMNTTTKRTVKKTATKKHRSNTQTRTIAENKKKSFDELMKHDIVRDEREKHFIRVTFHDDFRDVMDIIDLLCPYQRDMFIQSSETIIREVEKEGFTIMVEELLENMNEMKLNIAEKKDVQQLSIATANKDDRLYGYDKVQESLGRPRSIYTLRKTGGIMKLKDIISVRQLENKNETRNVITFIIVKDNTPDELVVKLTVMYNNMNPTSLTIEKFSIEGYKTDLLVQKK